MLATTDWVGIAAVISAVFAGLATLIGSLNHRTVSDIAAKVDTNGDPRTLGQIATDVAKAAGAPPPAETPAEPPPPAP